MSQPRKPGGRWVRPSSKCYGPRSVVSLIVESFAVPSGVVRGYTEYRFQRVHVAESHRWGRDWSEMVYRCFHSEDEFWDWLETETHQSRRVHVFAPNVIQAATLLNWWERLEKLGTLHETPETLRAFARAQANLNPPAPVRPNRFRPPATPGRDHTYFIRSIIDGATCSVLRYRCNGRSFLWCSHNQYVTCTEEEIAQALNYATFDAAGGAAELLNRDRTPMERALMWCRFMCGLSRWWERNRGGPWGATVAACAMSYLKMRLKPKTVLHHEHPTAHNLEESAIFGGRRSVWFVGNIGTESDWEKHGRLPPKRSPFGQLPAGMVHHDIRSMYPFLLSRCDYPCHLLTVRRSPSLESVRDTLERYGVIAAVTLNTPVDEYPQRTEKGIRWPIGRFTTTLAGPELAQAIGHGRVEEVHAAAVYKLGQPFKAAFADLVDLREKYREAGDHAYELFAKSLGNALSGKLAQREHAWSPRPDKAAPTLWGHWKQLDANTGRFREYRTLAGITWEKVVAETRSRPMGATYAYLTSYGRILMQLVRSCFGPRQVLAQDTDGIWTTAKAATSAYGTRSTEARSAGELHVTVRAEVGRFFGPQHYWWGQAWVLSGMAVPEIAAATNTAKVRRASLLYSSVRHTPEPVVLERLESVDMGRIHVQGQIDSHGWVVPHVLGEPDAAERLTQMGAENWWN